MIQYNFQEIQDYARRKWIEFRECEILPGSAQSEQDTFIRVLGAPCLQESSRV